MQLFLDANPGTISFMHVDMETYSPTRLALDLCHGRLIEGSLLLLDEHHGYPNRENGASKALNEVLHPDDYRYEAFATQQASIRMTRTPTA